MLGASGGGPQDVETMAKVLVAIGEGADIYAVPPFADGINWWHPMPFLLRHIVEDLRILYQEAVAGQPGDGAPDHAALSRWICTQTVLGEALIAAAKAITDVGDRRLLTLRGYMVPEGYIEGDESFGRRQPGDPPGFQRALVGNAHLRGES